MTPLEPSSPSHTPAPTHSEQLSKLLLCLQNFMESKQKEQINQLIQEKNESKIWEFLKHPECARTIPAPCLQALHPSDSAARKSAVHKNMRFFVSKNHIETLRKKPMPLGFPWAIAYQGNLELLANPVVAIVGSRQPTYYGREQAHRFATHLSQNGVTVLSGGALGIDSIANAAAFSVGPTAVVLGSGLDCPTPLRHADLFRRLSSAPNGLLISEFMPDFRAQKWSFPKRNNTIANLADFVLVIEAKEQSGSLITAHRAVESGVDVGALPGPLDCPLSQGPNFLIQQGAFCILKPDDILERLFTSAHPRPQPAKSNDTP